MLSRAALRAVQSSTHLRHASPLIPATSSRLRTYASGSKPPRAPPPPPLAASKPARRPAPPPPKPAQQPSKGARQTSPGTSFPKDQTWKPQDGIKLGGPAAATVSGAGQPVGQAVGKDEAASLEPDEVTSDRVVDSGLKQDVKGEKPLAQEINADGPEPGDIRHQTHEAQAQAENIPQHPSEPTEAQSRPQQPLPDLRQGIPSTFNLEFGQGKQASQRAEAESGQNPELDLTYEASEGQQQRDRGERDYDNSAYETSLDRRRARLANYMYATILAAAVGGAFWFSRPFGAEEGHPASLSPEEASGWSPGKMYARVRARWGDQLGYYTEPAFPKLLPEMPENQRPPFTLVIALEDLMIHTTWDREHGYRTAKRPGLDYFIRYLQQYYELVLFTNVPLAMADPVIRKLDPYHLIMWSLGREATKYEGGEYVKDLAYLNRDLKKVLIVDTEKRHVKNQPENAIVIPKWSGDPKDPHTKDLVALIPFLEYVATMGIDDVRTVLKSFEGTAVPEEFARREAEARKKFHAQLEEERKKRPKRSLGSLGSALGIKSSPQMGGGMVLADGQSVAEGFAQGKMLSDQIREQGQRQYEYIEKQIREHGEQWLKDEKEETDKMMQ